MNKRIRLFEIVSSFDIEAGGGGLTRFAIALSRNLNPQRFQAVVCALWDRGSELERRHVQDLREEGIEAFCCALWDEHHPYRSFYRATQGLQTVLKRQPADILHSHSEFSDMAVIFLKLTGNAPILVRTMHNELRAIWKRRPFRRLLFSQTLEPLLFDLELGVSQFIKENLDGRWLAKRLKRKAWAVPNALDIRRFQGETALRLKTRQELGIPEEAYVIGSVGRLYPQKGYDLLVAAAAEVENTDPEVRFVIVGDGIEEKSLRQKACDLGLAERVIFTGRRRDVEALFSAMDLFACSSRWEGLSTVLMEAMAAGVPIVATDIPGNRELLRDGENAWLVPSEDARALALTLKEAMESPDRGCEFAKQARIDVQAYGIESVAAQHEKLYLDVLAQKATDSRT